MKWLKKIFSTEREFVGDFVETADALLDLAASNQIVSAELENFSRKVATQENEKEKVAELSANALSGYGISVSKQAFLETLKD